MQLFAHVGDILHFYLDRMVNEAFLPTVFERENLINLLKLIDYKLASAAPASVDLTFTLSQTYVDNVTIPKGIEVQSVTDQSLNSEVVYFETDNDLIIPAGSISGEISATEGKGGSENLGNSEGTAYQQFAINAFPIIDGTLKVFVDSGEWTEVDSLALSKPDSEEYYIQRDADEKITLFFGDNSQGKIPASGTEITVEYRVGGGTRGNLGANIITIINSSIMHQGSPISVSVTNNEAVSGGADREKADNARTQAPLQLRALNRCVTEDDYETMALGYTGVARAKSFPVEPKSYRIINLYIVPNGGGLPSGSLKTGLQSYLDGKRMILDMLTVQDPDYVTVDIEGTVYVKSSYLQAVVEDAVLESLDSFFHYASEYLDFGIGIYLSDLFRLLDEIEGVDHVNLDKVFRIPVVKYDIWDGDAVFGNVAISSFTKEETWTVELTSPAAFKVTGAVSGLQANTGTFGVEYSSDNNEIIFTITEGSHACKEGNKATFKTSQLVGNINLEGSEFPKKGTFNLNFSDWP